MMMRYAPQVCYIIAGMILTIAFGFLPAVALIMAQLLGDLGDTLQERNKLNANP